MLVGRWKRIKINNMFNLQIVINAVEEDETWVGAVTLNQVAKVGFLAEGGERSWQVDVWRRNSAGEVLKGDWSGPGIARGQGGVQQTE